MTACDTGFAYSRGYGKFDNTPHQRWAPDFVSFREAVLLDRATDRGQQWIAGPCATAPDDEPHRVDAAKAAAIGRHHRCKSCALPRGWIGLDIDDAKPDRPALTPESFSTLVQLVQANSCFVYTTASHTDAAPRCRIIFELDLPLPRAELIRATRAQRDRLDAEMVAAGYHPLPWDSACDKPEQPLYLPLEAAQTYISEGERPLAAGELLALASDEATSEATEQPQVPLAGQPDAYALAALADALKAISAAYEGTRNDVANREAYGLGGFVGAGRLSRLMVEHMLIHQTREAGWQEPAKTEATIRQGIAAGMLQPRLDGSPSPILMTMAPPDASSNKLTLVDLSGLRAANIEPPSFVMEPLIPRGTLTLFAGHGGSGKSLLALIWAAHIACGRDWAGFRGAGPMRVLFASLEDPGQVVAYRLRAIVEGYNLDYDLIQKNLVVADGADQDASLVSEVSELGVRHLRPTPRLAELAELANGAGLIVVDNASDTFDGDENNRRQVRYFIRLLARLARRNNAGVVLLSHIDKAAAIHGGKGNSYSGSTAWHNSARSRLALEGGKCPKLTHEKANLSAIAEPVYFEWKATLAGARILVPGHTDNASVSASIVRDTEDDAEQVLLLLALAAEAGPVPAAMSGSYTAMHAVEALKETPAVYRSGDGRKRVRMAIVELLRTKRLRKVEIKVSNRNTKLVLELTQSGAAEVARVRASNPHTPSVTDARAEERASVTSTSSANVTDATNATHAGGFVFHERAPGIAFYELEDVA